MNYRIVATPQLGRIVIPAPVPHGFALWYTTLDFSGKIDAANAAAIVDVARELFTVESTLTTCSQVHGFAARRGTPGAAWRECDTCDALWSTERKTALGIKIADCLPVTLIDPSHRVIANIHSGWRGAVQKITALTVDSLWNETRFDATTSYAYLGPSIRVCCFEVGEEVVEQFQLAFPDADRYVDRTRGAKPHLDLPALTASLLGARGIADDRLIDTGLCTRCDGSIFHSFRRDPKRGGRNLAIVAQ
ncbi:MAG: purine-nucleoside/S-methyl-5-thioadenosine phosphorylase / adenosine deaminase [Acidobacteriota bacterium]|jgi:YfiH family protein|nr:purine-nucleoside/S-methyl-5-thioadenosine phosphorylase / adenosine deaminase [Acidobacteriota bacterium]